MRMHLRWHDERNAETLLFAPCSIELYRKFKDFQSRIMVSTNLLGRGIDVERVNVVINYDMPDS